MIVEPEAPTMTPLLSQMEEKPVDVVAVHLDVWTLKESPFTRLVRPLTKGKVARSSRNKRLQPGA
jgi:hypothetical protein